MNRCYKFFSLALLLSGALYSGAMQKPNVGIQTRAALAASTMQPETHTTPHSIARTFNDEEKAVIAQCRQVLQDKNATLEQLEALRTAVSKMIAQQDVYTHKASQALKALQRKITSTYETVAAKKAEPVQTQTNPIAISDQIQLVEQQLAAKDSEAPVAQPDADLSQSILVVQKSAKELLEQKKQFDQDAQKLADNAKTTYKQVQQEAAKKEQAAKESEAKAKQIADARTQAGQVAAKKRQEIEYSIKQAEEHAAKAQERKVQLEADLAKQQELEKAQQEQLAQEQKEAQEKMQQAQKELKIVTETKNTLEAHQKQHPEATATLDQKNCILI